MTAPDPATLRALETKLLAMPPARALQPRIAACDDGRLRIEAPLAANVNDKGTAFGGSMASLMTLAAWALASLQVERAGLRAEVFVADAGIRYLVPLRDDLRVEASLAADASWDTFLATLRARGRARVALQAQVLLPDGGIAANAQLRFAAILARD